MLHILARWRDLVERSGKVYAGVKNARQKGSSGGGLTTTAMSNVGHNAAKSLSKMLTENDWRQLLNRLVVQRWIRLSNNWWFLERPGHAETDE